MLDDGETGKNKDARSVFRNGSLAESFDASARPIVTVDVKKYQSWIDDSNLSDEQKEEFLQALWSIVVTFVELGFGVHPLQEVCGQESETFSQTPKEIFDPVRSKGSDETEKAKESSPIQGLEVE